jgi:urease accessory protein UreF
MNISDSLIEKIQALPAERIAEVEDFVDFLSRKMQRQAAIERLLSVAPALEAAGVAPPTEAEIEREVQAVRQARRRNAIPVDGAGRS